MKLSILLLSVLFDVLVAVPVEDGFPGKYQTISTSSQAIVTETTKVAALGRVADLGDFYDARRDDFIAISLFQTDLSGDAVHATDNAYSSIDYVRSEALSEKMEKLGVSASLGVSVLGGLVDVSGSGKYLSDEKQNSKSAKTSLVYSLRTVREDLKIFSKTSKDLIDKSLLEYIDATHVVVGIDWGADVVLSLEETNTDSSNAEDVQAKLELALKFASFSVSAGANVNVSNSDVEQSATFSLHLNGDIIPNTVPQTINESVAFIRSIPQLIEKENSGKGKIMNYILMPLATVQRVFEIESNKSGVVKEIDQELIDQFMRIFQEMKDSELQINDVYNEMNKWTLMIPEDEFTDVSNIKSDFDSFTNDLRVKFANLVIQYRNGELDDQALKDLIDSYENGNWTSKNINKILEGHTSTMHKIRLMNLYKSFGALFLDRRTDKYKILADNYEQEVRILSADLNTDISSPYVREIVRLLEAEAAKETGGVSYYIEEILDSPVPKVSVYLEGNLLNDFPVGRKEYVVLVHEEGIVIIVDARSYEQVATYTVPELSSSSIAIVDDTFYNIDTKNGKIMSTNIENIVSHNEITWSPVGSFPAASIQVRSVAAVNDSSFYFGTYDHNALYRYDTISKTVTNCGAVTTNPFASLVIVNNVLFFYSFNNFYSYDGVDVTQLKLTETRYFSGLFEFGGKVCRVGGDFVDVVPYTVYCYNPATQEWEETSHHANEARYYPAVTRTGSGTLVFGGESVSSDSSANTTKLDSAEILDHNTEIWSFIPSPPAMQPGNYLAATFYF